MSPKYKSKFALLRVPHHDRIPLRLRQVITEAYVDKRVSKADLVNLGHTIGRIHEALGSDSNATDAQLKSLFDRLKSEDEPMAAYRQLNQGLHSILARLSPDMVVRYVKGPLRGSFPDHSLSLNANRVVTLGHESLSHFSLPASRHVALEHALIGRQEIDGKPTYYLQSRQGPVRYRHDGEWFFSTLRPGKQDAAVIEDGLQFKIGPHTFQVDDLQSLPPAWWTKPISRKAFVRGGVLAAGAAAGALWLNRDRRPVVEITESAQHAFEQIRNPSPTPSFASRIQIGAYPFASGNGSVKKAASQPVHFMPHGVLAELGKKTGVAFRGNQVFVRLNQESQARWMRQSSGSEGAVGFFSKEEKNNLLNMVRSGVQPHFVIEPTDGLYNVPKYSSALESIAKDVAELGTSTVQFAPGLNSPKVPYYWRLNPASITPQAAVREAFKTVHDSFKSQPNVSVVFSPLLPHDPAHFVTDEREISDLTRAVKPYVSGAGGLFYPNSLEAVAGLDRYADVLQRQGMPFLGLDGFATRGGKPFEESLKRFKDPAVSREWKYLNFSDVPNTLVEKGSHVHPWTLTPEKLRMIRDHLSQ